MMRFYLFCVLIFSATLVKGQIKIDDTNMPKTGDTLRYSIALVDTSILFNYADTGSNLKWEFDSLIPIRQGVSEYLNSSETPYKNNVPNRIAEKIADTLLLQDFEILDVYEFYNNDSVEFAKDHRAGRIPTGIPFFPFFEFPLSYKDKDEIYQFPLEYKNRDSSTYNFLLDTNILVLSIYYGSKGYRINEVDAWGELSTPFGTFDCIRVKTDIVGYDTLDFDGNDFGIESHTREYKWLTTDFAIPALIVSGQVIDSTFIPATVQYRDSARGLPGLFAPVALFIADSTVTRQNQDLIIRNLTFSVIPTTYQWDISPANFNFVGGTSSSSADSIIVNFTDTGFFDVSLIARNKDGVDSLFFQDYIQVEAPNGIYETTDRISKLVSIFPNPVKAGGEIKIGGLASIKVNGIEVYDNNGVLLYNNVSDFVRLPTKPGVYYLKIETDEGLAIKKLIIQ